MSRSELALQMICAAAKNSHIELHFGASPSAIDFANQNVRVASSAPLVDDSASVLRHLDAARDADSPAATSSDGVAPDDTCSAHSSDSVLQEHAMLWSNEEGHPVSKQSCEDAKTGELAGGGRCRDSAATAERTCAGARGAAQPQTSTLSYDLLLAADGSHSQVRCSSLLLRFRLLSLDRRHGLGHVGVWDAV